MFRLAHYLLQNVQWCVLWFKFFHTRLHGSLCINLNICGHHLQGSLCMVGMWWVSCDFGLKLLHGSLWMVAMWWVSCDFGLKFFKHTIQSKPSIGRCLCIWWCIEKWVGLLKTLIHLVQLWASILSECFCGASAAIWSPTVKHNSRRAVSRLLNTKHFHTRLHGCCAWCPCGEWVVTWGLNSSYILCSWNPI